jgi:hypothetical protein
MPGAESGKRETGSLFLGSACAFVFEERVWPLKSGPKANSKVEVISKWAECVSGSERRIDGRGKRWLGKRIDDGWDDWQED